MIYRELESGDRSVGRFGDFLGIALDLIRTLKNKRMNIKKLTYRTILGVMLLLPMLAACTGNEVPVPEVKPVPEQKDMPIRWEVQPEGMQESRTLLNSILDLRNACNENGGKLAIGIWSAYQWGNEYKENILGNKVGDVGLIYQLDTNWDNWNGWTYGEYAAIWKHGAIHYFNAYFPKQGGLANIVNTKTAIQGDYNTEEVQMDLMVTRTVVDTGANDFQGSPVALPMKHALAALRFQFQAVDDVTKMCLKSFSLNNDTSEGLANSGTLTYDTGNVALTDWTYQKPELGSLYVWQHPGEGFSFNNTNKATAYWPATNTVVGNQYTENDGYIMIIPQEYNGGTKMKFTIDDTSFDVELPAQDFLPGYRYHYLMKVKDRTTVTLECVAQPWDLVETTNEFSTVVSVLESDRISWTQGSHNDNDNNPNNKSQIILWDDRSKPAEFSFKISRPLGSTWHAIFRTISGATDAFELRDLDGNIKTDGAVGEEVTLRVHAKRDNTTSVSNVAELMFVVRSNGQILPVDIITRLGGGKNYEIVQNINK